MIRRTHHDDAGAESWVLISQVEHARLAGMLAERWGQPPLAPLTRGDELLAAIYHHDDGWADWERTAGVDVESGRPLDFTEMPLVESLAIWRDSIASSAKLGKLAGYLVSAHFCALLRRFSSGWRKTPSQTAIAEAFLADQEEQQSAWLDVQQKKSPAIAAAAEDALAFLQTCDALSLWLCCSQHPSPQTFALAGAPPVTFRSDAEFAVTASPWPFLADRFELEAVGRSVPAIRYETPAALATAPAQPARMRWSFSRFCEKT
ncbi:MAG TPA: DUF3891 family protein [Pirellulales bacterium]|jgi:hypothetical protein|nr:DUF3891 family protein [Pirellulales bacterium]